MTLGIIGTAGRGPDQDRLTEAHWRMMCCISQTVATTLGTTRLVSGGAAWADHVAVQLYLDGIVDDLTLHLPTRFHTAGSENRFDPGNSVGETANRYHVAFYHARKVDSLDEISVAINKGAGVTEEPAGSGYAAFFARNAKVAEADALLAFTFSGGPLPADGGTKDTWDKFGLKAQREWDRYRKESEQGLYDRPCGCSCGAPPDDWFTGYHFDLTTRRLYRHVFEDKRTVAERAEQAAEAAAEEARAQVPPAPIPRTPEEERLFLL